VTGTANPVGGNLLAGFYAGGRLMAIDAYLIDGIVRVPNVTPVPRAPDYVRGVINLRGSIVVVIDLACRIGLAPEDRPASGTFAESDRRIIVVSREGESVGFLVDAAADVMEVAAGEIKDAPPNVLGTEASRFTGAYDGPLGLASILDVNALLAAD